MTNETKVPENLYRVYVQAHDALLSASEWFENPATSSSELSARERLIECCRDIAAAHPAKKKGKTK